MQSTLWQGEGHAWFRAASVELLRISCKAFQNKPFPPQLFPRSNMSALAMPERSPILTGMFVVMKHLAEQTCSMILWESALAAGSRRSLRCGRRCHCLTHGKQCEVVNKEKKAGAKTCSCLIGNLREKKDKMSATEHGHTLPLRFMGGYTIKSCHAIPHKCIMLMHTSFPTLVKPYPFN